MAYSPLVPPPGQTSCTAKPGRWGVVKPLRRQLFGSAAVPHTDTPVSVGRPGSVQACAHQCRSNPAQRPCPKKTGTRRIFRYLEPCFRAKDRQTTSTPTWPCWLPEHHRRPWLSPRLGQLFLVQLTVHGPLVLRQLLILHWRWHAASSWLAQLSTDIDLVAMYCPDAVAPIQGARPVESLLDSLVEDPRWWLGQVKKAVKQAQVHLERWRLLKSKGAVSLRLAPPSAADLPYQCGHCGAAFCAP